MSSLAWAVAAWAAFGWMVPCDACGWGGKGGTCRVEVQALSITKPMPKPAKGAHGHDAMMSGGMPGTELTLLLTTTERHIVGLDEDASRLTRFADDKGTVLAPQGRGQPARFLWPRVSADGRLCVVGVRADATPSPGATKLLVQGELAVRCGEGEKTVESDEIDLKAGAKLTLGTITVTVKQDDQAGPALRLMPMPSTQDDTVKPAPKPDGAAPALKPDSGGPLPSSGPVYADGAAPALKPESAAAPLKPVSGAPAPDTDYHTGTMFPPDARMNVTLSANAPLDLIKSVTFLGPDGKPIRHRQTGTMSMGLFGHVQHSVTYGLQKKVSRLKLKVVHFERIESVKVPLAVETGVGL